MHRHVHLLGARLLFGGVPFVVAVGALLVVGRESARGPDPLTVAVATVTVAASCWLLYRALTVDVVLGSSMVVVRNALTTRRIRRADVVGIQEHGEGTYGVPCLRLRSGGRVKVSALAPVLMPDSIPAPKLGRALACIDNWIAGKPNLRT